MNTIISRPSPEPGASKKRRSTRLFQAVPLKISGQNKTGTKISELTSALAVNCHGCVYSSRYEYVSGSWVTLHILTQELDGRSQSVRAQVKFVGLPRNPRDLYQVGVELEAPANVWGIQAPPQDWLGTSGNGMSAVTTASPESGADRNGDGLQTPEIYRESPAAAVAQPASASSPREKGAPAVPSDLLQQALGEMLQQAANRAVEAALSSRLNSSVNRAAKAIENFSQASARRMEEHCARTREKFEISLSRDLMARLQSDFAAAEQQFRQQMEGVLSNARHAAEVLEQTAAEAPLRAAEAQAALRSTAGELEAGFSTRLRETTEAAGRQYRDETTRISGERLSSWNETITAVTNAAAAHLQESSAEVQGRLETTAARSIENVQALAEAQIAQVAGQLRERSEAHLATFAAEARAEWDARERACKEEVARVTQQEIGEFRGRLEAVLNSAMTGAISAANEHSRILLDSLLRGTAEQLQESLSAKASG